MHGALVTVTDVELTKDLRIARVFVTTLERGEAERHVFDGLAKASGFVRAELGRRLTLRYLPELIFVKDVSGSRGDRILELLEGLHRDEAGTEAAGSPEPVHPDHRNDDDRRGRCPHHFLIPVCGMGC
ncbi:MAG: 30S ribosome-binding factor RbfA [Nitrospiraceae bacterium]